jgi:hypothetical protein
LLAVSLNAGAKTAAVAPFFADNATATGVNGSNNGKKVTLALTDPDSNGIGPSTSPQFSGDFVLNSQGDEELIFSGASGQELRVLRLSNSVDDIACPAPGYPANSLGTIDLTSGKVGTVATDGLVMPKGLIFVP